MTVFTDWIGQRVIAMCGRYWWRGELAEERGPFAILKDATQGIGHSATAIEEEIEVGEVRLNAASMEALYLEAGVPWIPKGRKTRAKAPASP